ERQSRKGAFEVRLRTEATVAALLAESPDAVIVATGSRPVRLEIAGAGAGEGPEGRGPGPGGCPPCSGRAIGAKRQRRGKSSARSGKEKTGPGVAWTVHEAIAGAADGAQRVVVFDREGFNRPLVAADALSSRGAVVEFVT